MDIEVDASAFVIPSKVNMTDYKVEAREQVTTPAGEFDCLVISQRVSTKVIVKVEAGSMEWYAKGIGMVRSESYNKKGKLVGYDVLTELK